MKSYLDFVEKLVAEGKSSGENQNDEMVHYTELSHQRMKRWNKTGKLIPEMIERLSKINEKQHWIVITESWCGDAAHAYMFLKKMADANSFISLAWKLRDENLDLMDRHLTNGSRAIPKIIAFDKDHNELWNWGPRPKHMQEKYWELRKADANYKVIMIELQRMYNEDKGETMQREILELMNQSPISK